MLICGVLLLVGIRAGLPYYRMYGLIAAIDREEGRCGFRPMGPAWLHRPNPDPLSFWAKWVFMNLVIVDLSYENNSPQSMNTSKFIAELAEYPTLESLDLSWRELDEADCIALGRMKGLIELNLSHTGLTDAGLRHLSTLPQLIDISLAGTRVTDEGLMVLKHFPNLRGLALDDTPITDGAVEPLKQLHKLETLTVSQTQFTESAAHELLQTLPDLNISDD